MHVSTGTPGYRSPPPADPGARPQCTDGKGSPTAPYAPDPGGLASPASPCGPAWRREREGAGSGRRRAARRPPRTPPGTLVPSSPVSSQQRLVDQHDEEGAGSVEERRQRLGHPGGQPGGGRVSARAVVLAGHVQRPLPAIRQGCTPAAPPRPSSVPAPGCPERARPKQEGPRRELQLPGHDPRQHPRAVGAGGVCPQKFTESKQLL